MNSPPTRLRFPFRGETLELRCPDPHKDAKPLIDAIDASLPELRRYMLWAHSDYSEPFQLKRMEAARQAYLEGKDFVFHLWSRDRILGGMGLHPRALNPKALEVGYWIRTAEVGRGLATAGVKVLAAFTFHHLGYERLQCLVNRANIASLRVVERVGFHLEGELRFWESQGTPEHRQAGFESSPSSLMHALTRDDLDTLDWYLPACRELELLE